MGGKMLGDIMLNRIYQMDCLEGMKLIPDRSIDLICIDPPYNISKDVWDKWKTIDEYVRWMGLVFKECERLLKNTGSFYWFHNDFEQMSELQYWIKRNTKFFFKQLLVWDKYNGSNWSQLNADVYVKGKRNYSKQSEYCLFYTVQNGTGLDDVNYHATLYLQKILKEHMQKKGFSYSQLSKMLNLSSTAIKHWIDYPTQPRFPKEENYNKIRNILDITYNFEEIQEIYQQKRKEYESMRYTFNTQELPNVWQHEPVSPNGHITPKPEKIIENIIKTSSNPGDIVLDCFLGSGTTAVVAEKNNRKWIGFEIEAKYIKIANKRLQNKYKNYI